MCEKPVDDYHHVFWVGVLHVMQAHKFLLLTIKLSVALSINLNLEKLGWFSLCWLHILLLLKLFLSQRKFLSLHLFFGLLDTKTQVIEVRELREFFF